MEIYEIVAMILAFIIGALAIGKFQYENKHGTPDQQKKDKEETL